jgi:hypothetical protein
MQQLIMLNLEYGARTYRAHAPIHDCFTPFSELTMSLCFDGTSYTVTLTLVGQLAISLGGDPWYVFSSFNFEHISTHHSNYVLLSLVLLCGMVCKGNSIESVHINRYSRSR